MVASFEAFEDHREMPRSIALAQSTREGLRIGASPGGAPAQPGGKISGHLCEANVHHLREKVRRGYACSRSGCAGLAPARSQAIESWSPSPRRRVTASTSRSSERTIP